MGLDMKTKRKICKEIYKRYQKARKKDKTKILDEYSETLAYNRDYLAHLLANWEKIRYSAIDGKSCQICRKGACETPPGASERQKNRQAGKI